jgi:radical SAM superfamily enzyme YgiQ (UPF0313 family)
MKLLLVDNLILPEEGSLARLDVHPHLGLLALAAVAEAAGHGVDIYDPKRLIRSGRLAHDATLYECVAAELLARGPAAVGFTTLGCSFLFAVNVARVLVRREPDLPVLIGGPHATMLHRQILERFPQFAVVCRHECDETLPEVLAHLETRAFDRIPGVTWHAARGGVRMTEGRPKVTDLDTLPIASYDHYPVAHLGLELLRIEAGRGCPFHCTFCSTAGFFQRSFRLKSAERLVRELDILHAEYGYSDFKLDHDMFTVSRRKIVEFCEAVRGRGYRWRASARVDRVDEALLETMAGAGCVGLYFGIETGSRRMQEVCRKRLDLGLVRPILAVAERLGIETTASFITGYPQELPRDQDETLDMIGDIASPSCLTQLHVLTPEPGTPLFDQYGAELAYDGYGGPYNAKPIGTNDETLIRAHPELFPTYHYYPAAMARARHVFAAEGVALLRRVGPVVLRYLLRAYDGRLSNFVRALRSFARGRMPDGQLVEAYVRARFGGRHHLTSLVRYGLCVHAGGDERVAPSPIDWAAFDPDVPYRVGPGVRVHRDLHDCGLVLERVARDPAGSTLLDDSEMGERGAYLVRDAGEAAMTCRLDPGVEAILSLFQAPQTCNEATRVIGRATGVSAVGRTLFRDLVRARILVAAAGPHVDAAPG